MTALEENVEKEGGVWKTVDYVSTNICSENAANSNM